MGAICPAPSSLYFFKLSSFVGSNRSSSRIRLVPFALSFTRLSFTRSKPLYLRNTNNHKDRSFNSFYSANSKPGRDSDRKGKKQRWIATNVGDEGSGFSSAEESDKQRIEMETTREEEEQRGDLYGTESRKDASQGNRSRLWDFFKLRREKEFQPVIEKGSDLNGEKIEIQWRDILDPTPENLPTLLLTGLLGFAVLRLFWQLLLVAVTIVIAAFKYSIIAAVLLAFLVVFL